MAAPSPRRFDSAVSKYRARLLVVDDDITIRTALKAVLENANYEVLTVCDGTRALLQLGLGGLQPSIIILDIAMPGLDGIELMDALSNFNISKRPDVIILSAYLDPSNSARAAALGARFLLAKPVAGEALLAAVRDCLENQAPRDEINDLKQ
jgi:CheY-like chemotaxis protein